MELHPLVEHEWRDDHRLSRRSLIWIEEHAEPGDLHPIATAIAQLRGTSRRLPVRQHLELARLPVPPHHVLTRHQLLGGGLLGQAGEQRQPPPLDFLVVSEDRVRGHRCRCGNGCPRMTVQGTHWGEQARPPFPQCVSLHPLGQVQTLPSNAPRSHV